MDRPMTTKELFLKIHNSLEKRHKIPSILDYGIATNNPVPIKTYEFDLKSNLAYGGSEGIYLDLWIEYFVDNERCRSGIGTYKTLDESCKAMHIMAALLADFIIEEYGYVNANPDDFTWEGVNVYPFDGIGTRFGSGCTCGSMETALKKKDELLKMYPRVIVRDNATREKRTFDSKIINWEG